MALTALGPRRASADRARALASTSDDARRPAAVVRHARSAALATGCAVAAHLSMAAQGGWMAGLAVAMAAVCAPCAWTMWRQPSVHGARMLVAMALSMALLHAALVLWTAPATAHSHGQSASVAAAAEHAAHLGPALVVVVADFAAALLSASWVRRVVAGS